MKYESPFFPTYREALDNMASKITSLVSDGYVVSDCFAFCANKGKYVFTVEYSKVVDLSIKRHISIQLTDEVVSLFDATASEKEMLKRLTSWVLSDCGSSDISLKSSASYIKDGVFHFDADVIIPADLIETKHLDAYLLEEEKCNMTLRLKP